MNKDEKMEKMTAEDGKTPDLVAGNVEKMRELFPAIFAEGQIDFEALKQVLGDYSHDTEEHYSFMWHGKSEARRIAQLPSQGTLRPCPEESVNWDETQNIFIEGDNLEVLKLLQKSYHRKVKMIYIDPPYNTGKEFIYPDRFKDNLDTYLKYTGQVDDEGFKLSANSETSGRYHTNWLNMMYPRLKLARNLLRDDGVIFVSIDDHEVHNLRKMMDEIFGEEHFVANVVWQKKYAVSADDPSIAAMHDHILVYQRSSAFQRNLLPRTEKQTSRYKNPNNHPLGRWSSDNYVSNKSRQERPTLWYPIIHPKDGREVWPAESAVWRYSKEKHAQMVEEDRLYWGPDLSYEKPRLRRFLNEIQQGIVPPTWWPFLETGHNDEAQKETGELIGKKVFSTPKPVRLMDRILQIGTESDDLVLDFFAGSAAFGHAVYKRNVTGPKQLGLRFILVQLPENCDSNNKAVEQGFHNIAEISKERLRRSGLAIAAEEPEGDTGFKVFKLDSSNIQTWDADYATMDKDLFGAIDNIKTDRSQNDVLYELLLKYGLDLAIPVETRTIYGKAVFIIGAGALVVCLDKEIGLNTVKGIAALKAELTPQIMKVVFKDAGFADDVVKTNTVQILKQAGVDDVKSL